MAKRALIIDDSITIRQVVRFTLSQNGYEVVEASDGAQGLSQLGEEPFSVIVTDLNMPVMDGVTFITHARKHPTSRFVPILMLTTETQESKRQAGKAAGATAWLVKPFDPDKLLNVLARVVR